MTKTSFNVLIGEQKEAQYGGNIISGGGYLLCEIGEGRQDIVAHGCAEEIWMAEVSPGKFPMYSSNNNLVTRGLISRAIGHVYKIGEYSFENLNPIEKLNPPEGYWEFFCCEEDIYFTDYRSSETYNQWTNFSERLRRGEGFTSE